ncbi:MAG: hypothetical protein NVSMB31_19810 [Vulcanimicrobiaceae bacterium]
MAKKFDSQTGGHLTGVARTPGGRLPRIKDGVKWPSLQLLWVLIEIGVVELGLAFVVAALGVALA